MSPTPSPRRRFRRTALATAGVSLIACVAPLVGANPAAAINAPLTTTDGVGIRVDENAILGPALELIENEIQPFANQMIYNGALANSPAGTPKSLHVTSNVELGFDFINAGTTGFPQGGLSVHADLLGIEIRYVKDPVWPFADCSIYVRPDTATIDVSAKINSALLPNAPLQINPITAYWDDDPSVTSTGVCWTYLIDDFFDSIFTSGGTGSIADTIEAELNGQAQDLINDLWAEHVVPVINTLSGFGITFNQIRTDTNGLIVTANVNSTNGVRVPGIDYNFPVANTPDAGVTAAINTVLAQRREVIATIHPNVVAQYMNAIDQALGGQYGGLNLNGTAIEALLLPATARGLYTDTGWYSELATQAPPKVTPTGTGGAPLVTLPTATVRFLHESDLFNAVATYSGSMSGIRLLTQIRPGSTMWGPIFNNATATVAMTRTQANAHSATVVAMTNAQLNPYARAAMDLFNTGIFIPQLSLAPIAVSTLTVTLCTTCTRITGDQRYTESFNVN